MFFAREKENLPKNLSKNKKSKSAGEKNNMGLLKQLLNKRPV
jgi:hypothetical protein